MTGPAFRLAEGVVWESLDDEMFAVYSGLSGETHLLNQTAVWVLELLSAPGWHHVDDVLRLAAAEAGIPADALRDAMGDIWPTLERGGLLQRRPAARSGA